MPFLISGRVVALSVLATALLGAAGQRESQRPFSRADADHFAQKLTTIAGRGVPPASATRARESRTVVTEPELNAYIRYRALAQIPAGVLEPYVWPLANGRLAGTATVDLDAVRESQPRGLFDPMRLLRGRVPVRASGVLRTGDGVGRFELESASAGGLPIPKSLLQELVSYYSRSTEHPDGVNMDAPFALPAGIRTIDVQPGQAIIVQ